MKIISIYVYTKQQRIADKQHDNRYYIKQYNLDSYYFWFNFMEQKKSIQEFCEFTFELICKNIKPGKLIAINESGYKIYVKSVGNLIYGMITDDEYPDEVSLRIIEKMIFLHVNKRLNASEFIKLYQNPENEQFYKINKDLDETKDIVYNVIDDILIRGEKLDDLIEKSNKLSEQTKIFYKEAKKTNSCCLIL